MSKTLINKDAIQDNSISKEKLDFEVNDTFIEYSEGGGN